MHDTYMIDFSFVTRNQFEMTAPSSKVEASADTIINVNGW